jgi:hypothetical protein
MNRTWIAAFAVCALVACGPHRGGDDESTAALSIAPATSDLLIENGVPAHQDFTATLTFPDGHTKDVTTETAFLIDSGFGSFTGNQLAIGIAGKTEVFGTYVDKTASAQVIARLRSVRVDPALDPNTPDLFTGPEDAARAPTVVYPPADVIIPRNLGDFEAHWIDGSGNDVFELSLHTEFADVRVYLPGGNGSAAAGPMPTYAAFTAAEWIAATGTEPTVQYQVRGVQQSNPGPVGAGPVRLVQLSNEPMEGGLYYWASTGTPGEPYGIFRHDMSAPGQPAEGYLTNVQAGRCVACHVLSRDGKKMAITYDGGGGAATMIDVGTTTVSPSAATWNFGTFTPDGAQFLAVEGGSLTVRDPATQGVIASLTGAGFVTHPDLSADGTKLVYVKPTAASFDYSFGHGQIVVRSYDQTTHTFGAEQILVSDQFNNYYPSWSPDGAWILFTRSTNNDPGDGTYLAGSYNNTDASLWVVKADGTQPPVQLVAANDGTNLTNSWGRWAPFGQSLGANHEPMYWVTVSSKRNFGVRLVGVGRPQIWMTPFFPGRATVAGDPSAPAFRLPFQAILTSNHIAQWTEHVVVTQ